MSISNNDAVISRGEIVAAADAIEPLPASLTRLLRLMNDNAFEMTDLVETLTHDPTLAGDVLGRANSTASGSRRHIGDLREAVTRIGTREVVAIAMRRAVKSQFNVALPAHGLDADDLWRHSVTTAFFTKEIARSRRRNVETAFLCGLLHDVGKVVLLGSLTPADLGAPEAELVAALDEHHVSAGLLLAEEWRLPAPVVESIRWHHEPASAQLHADVAMTVCFADQLSHHVAPGSLAPAPTEDELRSHDVLVGLNLYPDEVERLLGLGGRAVEFAGGCS